MLKKIMLTVRKIQKIVNIRELVYLHSLILSSANNI